MTNGIASEPRDSGVQVVSLLSNVLGPKSKKTLAFSTAGTAVWKAAKAWHTRQLNKNEYRISVPGGDRMFNELSVWMLNHEDPTIQKSVEVRSRMYSSGEVAVVADDGNYAPKVGVEIFYDGSTETTIRVDGYKIKVQVEKEDLSKLGDRATLRDMRHLTFTCPSLEARDAVLGHIDQISRVASMKEKTPRLMICDEWDWRSSELRERSIDSVVLADGQKERIVADLARFLASEHRYLELGIPYRRGILLHGPAGTGKTSLARALASHFRLDVYYMSLSSIKDDAKLIEKIRDVRDRSILLLEDVDIAQATHERDDKKPGITLQGLLNALDGVVTPHGLVTVLTTNKREALDEALTRRGRIDLDELVGTMQPEQAARLVEKLTGHRHELWRKNLVPANLIEVVKQHLDDKDAAFAACVQTFGV